MKGFRRLAATAAAVIACLTALPSAWALDPHITRSVNHGAYTAVGQATLGRDILLAIGGVHSQTHALLGPGGMHVPVTLKLNMTGGDYAGSVNVSFQGETGQYRIDYDDLVPMALFIDGGGTSLYTLWAVPPEDPNFKQRAGFTRHEHTGLVAIEFARSRFRESLYYIDLCDVCLGRNRPDVIGKLGGSAVDLGKLNPEDYEARSYINTDAGLIFGLVQNGEAVSVDGNIVRLHWLLKNGAAEGQVYRAEDFKTRAKLAQEAAGHEEELVLDRGLYELATVKHVLALHRDGQFLFGSLALLRTFKETGKPGEWAAFMSQIRALNQAHPGPWQAYSKSYCEVYPKECES
jgi:hypothetical protein